MQAQLFQRILAFVILLPLAASCAPPAPTSPGLGPAETLPTVTVTPGWDARPTRSSEPAQKPPRGTRVPGGQGQGSASLQSMPFDVPASPFNVILGRPTASSITLSLLSAAGQTVSISYGTSPDPYTSRTDPIALQANLPAQITLTDLAPDTQYFYSINGVENTFHTARAPGSTFTFTIQADSHLDSNTSPKVYEQTLANQRADQPDFMIDRGDTFMTEKYNCPQVNSMDGATKLWKKSVRSNNC